MNANELKWNAYTVAMSRVYRTQAELYRLHATASQLSPVSVEADYAYYMDLAAEYEALAEENEREIAA